jgi:hypothetical protein
LATPNAFWYTTLPRLATATTIPGNRPAVMSAWIDASSRDRRAADIPTL